MNYANHYMYTDVEPYEVVRVVSEKTIEIRAMKAERDESVSWSSTLVASAPTARTKISRSGLSRAMRLRRSSASALVRMAGRTPTVGAMACQTGPIKSTTTTFDLDWRLIGEAQSQNSETSRIGSSAVCVEPRVAWRSVGHYPRPADWNL